MSVWLRWVIFGTLVIACYAPPYQVSLFPLAHDVGAPRPSAIKLAVKEGRAEVLKAGIAAVPNKREKIVSFGNNVSQTSLDVPGSEPGFTKLSLLEIRLPHLSRQREAVESHFSGRTTKNSHLQIIGRFGAHDFASRASFQETELIR